MKYFFQRRKKTTMSNIMVFWLTWLLFSKFTLTVDGFFRRHSFPMEDSTVGWVANTSTTTTTTTTTKSVPASTTTSSTLRRKSDDTMTEQKQTLLKPDVDSVIRAEARRYQRAKGDSKIFQDQSNQDDLVFEGTFEYQSDLLPSWITSSPSDLMDFFLQPENRDLVIKGGGNPCESIPPSQTLYDEWKRNSQIVQSSPPDGQHEEILAVYSDVHLVPGLSISAVTYTGCKVLTEPQTELPYYEFTLVKEDYQGEGSRPMVWVFDKVTGKHSNNNKKLLEPVASSAMNYDNNNGQENSSRTYALSRVTIKHDAKENGCRVHYYGQVKVVSKLPKRMLHILPLPKRTVERKVSQSIVTQLEREGIQSVDKFAQALGNWTRARFPRQQP
jgi:hypothetical protein